MSEKLLKEIISKLGGLETKFEGLETKFDGLETKQQEIKIIANRLIERQDIFEAKMEQRHNELLHEFKRARIDIDYLIAPRSLSHEADSQYLKTS